MFRPIPAVVAVFALALVAGCEKPIQRSSLRTATPEASAGPECRQHCERGYRVCMDSAAPRRGTDDERRNRLFGPSAGCEEQLRACFQGCAPAQ